MEQRDVMHPKLLVLAVFCHNVLTSEASNFKWKKEKTVFSRNYEKISFGLSLLYMCHSFVVNYFCQNNCKVRLVCLTTRGREVNYKFSCGNELRRSNTNLHRGNVLASL